MDQRTMDKLKQIVKELEEKEKKKVLILSLGTGSILGKDAADMTDEEKKEKLARKEYSYRPAEYYFTNKKESITTEFVAEPLMKEFCPDEVFIIGTSKSSWTGFYGKFGEDNDNKDNVISRLFKLEEEGGKDVKDVKGIAEEIESCFQGIRGECFSNAKIHVIVTRYGLNGEELLENYCLIRDALGGVLNNGKANCKYEVAFDITHSFRSMPVYNLVILNYLRNISQIDLGITHIYYGNIEISRENDGKSPIVDLEELANVLVLSDSVGEFKNTGNAVSLIKCIPDSEKELKEALEAFDWATQINDYNAVIESFRSLINVCAQKNGDVSGKYADLREMILSVIKDKFFDDMSVTNMSDIGSELLNKEQAEMQYRLSKWYYKQNRYGQALATGLEALRSYLVPMYLKWSGEDDIQKNVNDMEKRDKSINRMNDLVSNYKNSKKTGNSETHDETADIFSELNYRFLKARPIRNIFAHNLKRKSIGSDFANQKEHIANYFKALDKFVELIRKDPDAVLEFYMAENSKQ